MSNRSEVSGAKREYRRVADELRASIEGGDIAFGEQLPTHAELVEQFDVSRATIQKALKALQDERYVQSIQGKGVFARDWNAPEPEGAPDVSHGTPSDALGLSEAIARSFTARHVTIDAYGLTSESLSAAIVPQVRQIMQGHPPPESIRVRLLLPVVDTRLAIARSFADPDDPRPLDRLRQLVDVHAGAVRNALIDLQDRGYVASVEVDIRTLAVTPVIKLYVLNSSQVLRGWYVAEERPVDLGPIGQEESVEIRDVRGLSAQLFPAGPQELAECTKWFESWWSAAARPVGR